MGLQQKMEEMISALILILLQEVMVNIYVIPLLS